MDADLTLLGLRICCGVVVGDGDIWWALAILSKICSTSGVLDAAEA